MDSLIELDVEMPLEPEVARNVALKARPIRGKILPPDESAEFSPEDIMEIPLLVRHESLSVGRRQARNRPARSRSTEQRNEKSMAHKKKRCYDFYDKGYCVRGEKCRYDHGQHPVVLTDLNFFDKLQNSGVSSFNKGYYVAAPDNSGLVPSSFNVSSSPDEVPKTPFNTPASGTVAPKVYQKENSVGHHPYSKVFSKTYIKPASVSKEENEPVKKDSLLRTLLDVHRRRTNLYKEQVDQQRLLLQKMQGVEDAETKGKYLKLIKKNNDLLKTLKSEIEFLGQDIIAMRSKKEEETKKAMIEVDSGETIREVAKQDVIPLSSENI